MASPLTWELDQSATGIDWDSVRDIFMRAIPGPFKALEKLVAAWPTRPSERPTVEELRRVRENPRLIVTTPRYAEFARSLPAAVLADDPAHVLGEELAQAFSRAQENITSSLVVSRPEKTHGFDASKAFRILHHQKKTSQTGRYRWDDSYFVVEQDGALIQISGLEFATRNAAHMTRRNLAALMGISFPALQSKFRGQDVADKRVSIKALNRGKQRKPQAAPAGFDAAAEFIVDKHGAKHRTHGTRKDYDWDSSFITVRQNGQSFSINSFDFIVMRAPHVSRPHIAGMLGLSPNVVAHRLAMAGLGHLMPPPDYYNGRNRHARLRDSSLVESQARRKKFKADRPFEVIEKNCFQRGNKYNWELSSLTLEQDKRRFRINSFDFILLLAPYLRDGDLASMLGVTPAAVEQKLIHEGVKNIRTAQNKPVRALRIKSALKKTESPKVETALLKKISGNPLPIDMDLPAEFHAKLDDFPKVWKNRLLKNRFQRAKFLTAHDVYQSLAAIEETVTPKALLNYLNEAPLPGRRASRANLEKRIASIFKTFAEEPSLPGGPKLPRQFKYVTL